MAGHSQFKNTMHRKGAQDAKRAKIFTKIIRELTVAAREGEADPNINPRLRSAIISARTSNMPKDTMERAIKKGAGGEDTTNYTALRYEGFGPGNVAIIVEALTDNRNRTAPEIRTIFNKHGGNLGESNSVSFMFDRVGAILYPLSAGTPEAFFEASLECGADNIEMTAMGHEITCPLDSFAEVRDTLMKRFGDPASAQLIWHPKTSTLVSDDHAEALLKFIDVLEDNDDVQNVFSNMEFSEAFAANNLLS